MVQCAYVIFSKEATINATTRQVSVKDFFSQITLRAPGTTDFSLVIGLWGIMNGKTASIDLNIESPKGKTFTGKWTTKPSKDEFQVQNVIFDLSEVPLDEDGIYTFKVIDKQTRTEIARRVLKVSFSKEGEDTFE